MLALKISVYASNKIKKLKLKKVRKLSLNLFVNKNQLMILIILFQSFNLPKENIFRKYICLGSRIRRLLYPSPAIHVGILENILIRMSLDNPDFTRLFQTNMEIALQGRDF